MNGMKIIFYSHANEFCTKPRFESETFWNSEMAYYHEQRFMENVKTKPRFFLLLPSNLGSIPKYSISGKFITYIDI